MTNDQSDAMEEGWSSENEVLSDLDNIEEILPQKTGEQTVLICLSADVPEDPNDTGVGEQEVSQPSEPSKPSEKQRAPQQLRR